MLKTPKNIRTSFPYRAARPAWLEGLKDDCRDPETQSGLQASPSKGEAVADVLVYRTRPEISSFLQVPFFKKPTITTLLVQDFFDNFCGPATGHFNEKAGSVKRGSLTVRTRKRTVPPIPDPQSHQAFHRNRSDRLSHRDR
jgi:hypothetical protein